MGGKIKETLFNHLIDAERQLLELMYGNLLKRLMHYLMMILLK